MIHIQQKRTENDMKINFISLFVTVKTTPITAAQEVAAGTRTSDLLI